MRKFIILFLTILKVACSLAQIENIGNKEYVFENNCWYQICSGKKYPLNNVLTIKFTENCIEDSILNFSLTNNLTFLRKNILGYYDFQVIDSVNIIEIVRNLIYSNLTEIVEPNSIGNFIGKLENNLISSNDPIYQWHTNKVELNSAWEIQTGSPNSIIAVLDSGTDWLHEDIGMGNDSYQNIYLNPGELPWSDPNDPSSGNGIDDDNNGYIDDWKGWNFAFGNNDSRGNFSHGTWVGGIIASKTNNLTGVSGIVGGWNNEGAKLLIVCIGTDYPDASIIDDAIIYSIQNGAKIINLSLGVSETTAINDALFYAYNNGALIFAASGNHPPIGSPVSYPASNFNTVAVGATNQNDYKSFFSNYGENLELTAPGENIYTTHPNNQYYYPSGTSFSSPIVSGIAALLWSYEPCLTNIEIRQILRETAEQVGGYDYNWNTNYPGHSLELGYGRVNAYEAILYVDEYLTQTISINTIWNNDQTVRSNLIIESGATLTINSNIKLGPWSNIIVKQGAKLVLDGAVLTSSLDCYDYNYQWQGIEVWGNRLSSQHTPGAQGIVEPKNGAVTENAVNGIRNCNPDDWNARGGIIICEDAVFRNNRRAVEFVQYHNILNDTEYDNLSGFYNTQFVVDDDYIGPSQFYAHTSLWDVKGVKFYGCTFEDNMSAKTYSENYHIGIHSIDAGYKVTGSCDIMPGAGQDCPVQYYHPCEFINLNFGIKATCSSSAQTLNVYRNYFENNIFAVYNSALNNSWVNRNQIQLGQGDAQGAGFNYGIYFTNSTEYRIEENKLTGFSASTLNTAGIIIENSGEAPILVYKDTLYTMNYRGFVAKSLNRSTRSETQGLQFQCNANNNHPQSSIDFHVFNKSGKYGIRGYTNPVSTYTTFTRILPDNELQSHIRISTLSGSYVLQYTINSNYGHWLWDTRNLDNGIYFYELIQKNCIFET